MPLVMTLANSFFNHAHFTQDQKSIFKDAQHQSCGGLLNYLWDFFSNTHGALLGILQQHSMSSVSLASDITTYAVNHSGKGLRPLLVIMSSMVGGGPFEDVSPFPLAPKEILFLAAAVEFIHTATLLHDDVIDEALIRRQKPSCFSKWGNFLSILGGDFLFAQAFCLMVETRSMEVLSILAQTAKTIVEGEIQQSEQKSCVDLSFHAYLDAIKKKTASLFAASTKTGYLLGKKDPQFLEAIEMFGFNLGIYFQILDDIYDYNEYKNEADTLGKKKGNDFKEKKITLPLLMLFKHCSKEKQHIKNLMQKDTWDVLDYQYVLQKMDDYKIFDQSMKYANLFAEKATSELKKIEKNCIVIDLLLYFTNHLPSLFFGYDKAKSAYLKK
jgi:octaprenyl-diphosphate synthase